MHVNILQIPGVVLIFRVHAKDDVILIQLGEHRRNLSLAERIVECVVQCLRGDAKAGRRVAVDHEHR